MVKAGRGVVGEFSQAPARRRRSRSSRPPASLGQGVSACGQAGSREPSGGTLSDRGHFDRAGALALLVRESERPAVWHTYISYLPQQSHFAFLPRPTSRVPPQQGPRYYGGVSLSLRTQPFLKRTLSAHEEDELVDEFAVGAAQRVVAAAHFCTAGWSWRRLIALTVFATSLISFGQIGSQQRALFFKALDFGQPALHCSRRACPHTHAWPFFW